MAKQSKESKSENKEILLQDFLLGFELSQYEIQALLLKHNSSQTKSFEDWSDLTGLNTSK